MLIGSIVLILSSCHHQINKVSNITNDSIETEILPKVDDNEYVFRDQAELNEAYGNWALEYNDSIEREFQKVISSFPQYNRILNLEKDVWKRYQEATRKVANFGDHGSSTPIYIADIIRQGIHLREKSFHNLYSYSKGENTSLSKTLFTSNMIAEAYTAFINSIGTFDERSDPKELEEHRKSLQEEQERWNEWISYRRNYSAKLPPDIKKIYDDCTNLMMRTKLIQLKNQNQALGIIGGEVERCALPDNCSDKALLEYPGFDKVMARHREDTDWYPNFE